MAALTALLISFIIGPRIIRFLHKKHIGEEIKSLGPESHISKKGTPTMGGIIILDFIDMLDDEHKCQVQRELARALGKDNAKTVISEISPLGLIEMTRRRTRESLGQILNNPCEVCAGSGYQKSAETVCYEIFREIMDVAPNHENEMLLVVASQLVVDRMLDEESGTVAMLEELVGKTVKYEVEPMYTQEQFDVVP